MLFAMKKNYLFPGKRIFLTLLLCLTGFSSFAENESKTQIENKLDKRLSGGKGTVFKTDHNAYSLPMANLEMMARLDFSVGNSFFRNPWVTAPASTTARDGLGPLFNTNGCQNCHIKDGRGHAPQSTEDNAVSLLVRLSVPSEEKSNDDASGTETNKKDKEMLLKAGNIAEPIYGGQLQDFAIPGIEPEGKIVITYKKKVMKFADGEEVELREPNLAIENLAYGEMHPKVQMSARIAPPMIGLGLLEMVPEEVILAWQDEEDSNNDGISGRANQVWDVQEQGTAMGRFGWKAGQPTLRQQNAAAFNGDLGITSSLFTAENCTAKQDVCTPQVSGGDPEVEDNLLDLVTFYTRSLAVPARRNMDSESVQKGYEMFYQAQCQACHREQLQTGSSDLSWLANQTFFPYTDLLLHDMGEGLADNRPEFIANGREWRTPPLWGIGLTEAVTGKQSYLHDGRARTLMEAVLWHGGEAEASQQKVLTMNREERQALIAFLESL